MTLTVKRQFSDRRVGELQDRNNRWRRAHGSSARGAYAERDSQVNPAYPSLPPNTRVKSDIWFGEITTLG